MRLNPHEIPDKIKRLMSAEDRKTLGDFAETREEINARVEAKNEKELQEQIKGLLNRSGITWYGWSRMDKATTQMVGWPDFVIPLPNGKTLYMEVKNGMRPPTNEQVKCLQWLHDNGHKTYLVRSYTEAVEIINENLQ